MSGGTGGPGAGGAPPAEELAGGPPGGLAGNPVSELRRQLAVVTDAVRDAYRDTTRLIRVLTVIGQPCPPDELMDLTLTVLSDVFSADVTCLLRPVHDRLVVRNACGLPEDDPAFREGWPMPTAGPAVLRSPGMASRHGGADLTFAPAPMARLGMESSVWIPLAEDGGRGFCDLLLLCRRGRDPFTQLDLQVLGSVADRLRLAVEERERTIAMEQLAQSGHLLARHLDLEPLLAEAAELLSRLTAADAAWLVVIEDGRGHLRGVAGEVAGDWPRPVEELPGWETARHGQPYACAGLPPAPGDGAVTACTAPGQSLLCVPVTRDGVPAVLLYAARDQLRPFAADLAEIVTIFANHVAAALANAELYRALVRSESSLRLVTDSISDLVAMVGADGCLVYASPSHERELGRAPSRLLGRPVTELVHPHDRHRVEAALTAALAADPGDRTIEYRVRGGDQRWVWVESALRPAPPTEATGGQQAVVLSSRVVEQRKRLEDELRRRATHDPLTGLANRTLVGQRLAADLARDEPGQVGLLFCDLDKFKAVNDRLGHEAGDELLKQVAARLRRSLRPGDLLGRFGGDEFVVVLDGVADLAAVAQVGRRVARALDADFHLGGERVRISASVGGVVGARRATTASDMLRDADAAMYAAKDRGPGLIQVFDDDASHRSLDRLGLRSDLLRALERRQLALAYQPIWDLETGRVLAFEALLRWAHPQRGPVPPDVFIPLAEETGAIIPIGQWVLERACRQLADWRSASGRDDLRMSVNLSPVQLQQPHLAPTVLAAIRAAGVHPTDLCLEVTEHSYLRDDVAESAAALRGAGISFALDDFGTSYSSLAYLKWFPIDILKIDRSFVAGMTGGGTDRGLVRAVLAIADALGVGVIAEGIETERQRAELRALNCTRGQGYLLSPALPAHRAATLLRTPEPLLAP
ncbi:putative bifunctional diguanylate cyclase/phosphodiesterase [Rhizomonospora bruguierae]|uniref:putative bifunctional diguanylate cyclase/phosphodiesterase n=1 Tax=Rhizomonospora bruguierae TaxID=1581705 RepID=UPI001BCDF5C8|nr:EAL domain-containing protein [Micromonospora sp. NBRC 107566]